MKRHILYIANSLRFLAILTYRLVDGKINNITIGKSAILKSNRKQH